MRSEISSGLTLTSQTFIDSKYLFSETLAQFHPEWDVVDHRVLNDFDDSSDFWVAIGASFAILLHVK